MDRMQSMEIRELTFEARKKVLKDIIAVLDFNSLDTNDPDYQSKESRVAMMSEFRRQLLLRFAGSILPRLTAGRDDDEKLFPEPLLAGESKKDGIPNDNGADENSKDEEENS